MIERDFSMRFLLKTLQAFSVTCKPQGQEFERGLASRFNVGGQIDSPIPPAPIRLEIL